MGLKDLRSERDEVARRLADREQRLTARLRALRRNARERYNITALLVAGAALGIALDQYVRAKTRSAARRRPPRSVDRSPARGPAFPLVSVLQFVATALLAPRAARRAPPPVAAPAQSERSNARATPSSNLDVNGLTRH